MISNTSVWVAFWVLVVWACLTYSCSVPLPLDR